MPNYYDLPVGVLCPTDGGVTAYAIASNMYVLVDQQAHVATATYNCPKCRRRQQQEVTASEYAWYAIARIQQEHPERFVILPPREQGEPEWTRSELLDELIELHFTDEADIMAKLLAHDPD